MKQPFEEASSEHIETSPSMGTIPQWSYHDGKKPTPVLEKLTYPLLEPEIGNSKFLTASNNY